MTEVTPEQRALYALARDLPRGHLPMSAQLEYDRLKPAWERGELADRVPPHDLEPALLRGSNDVRHTVDRSGTTHTYRLFNGWQITGGVLCMTIVAFSAVFPISGLFTPGFYKGYSAGKTAGLVLLGCVIGLAVAWLGSRQFRIRAQVSGHKLMIRNTYRTYAIDASSIRAITVKEHSSGEGTAHWFPWVELTSGRGVWIDGIDCGRVGKPPRPERVAVVEEIQALLARVSNDHAPRQGVLPGRTGFPEPLAPMT
jgi:hypothetical protein